MKNKILIYLIFIFFSNFAYAENLFIQSEEINIDKNKEVTIFKNNVIFKTQDNKTIKSEYAEYDKKSGLITLKNKVILIDEKNNIIETDFAEYFENEKKFKSNGATKIITSEGYNVQGSNIISDQNRTTSNEKTIISDLENNTIFLDNFEFDNNSNIFKSIGFVKIEDKLNNIYEFSQIYIDTKKRNFRFRYKGFY